MSKSYGFIEITGVVAAMDALDIMCKTADVELASWQLLQKPWKRQQQMPSRNRQAMQ